MAKAKTTPKKPAATSGTDQVKEALELIKLMSETGLAELDVETPQLKLSLKKNPPLPVGTVMSLPQSMSSIQYAAPAASTGGSKAAEPKPEIKAAIPGEAFHKVLSPMAGTFYRAPGPSSPPYVKEGDTVSAGQPVCIVEAMKLMNEIKCDKAGKIVNILVENAQSVEKGTILFWVETKV